MKISRNSVLKAAVATVILAVATVSFISIRQSQRVRNTSSIVSNTELLLNHIRMLVFSITDNEASTNGYIITGSNEYLERTKRSERDSYFELAMLKKLITDKTSLQLLNDSLTPYVEKRLALSDQLIAERQKDTTSKNIPGQIPTGRFYAEQIRRLGGKIRNRETEWLYQHKKNSVDAISRLNFTLYLILVLILILVILIIRRAKMDIRYIMLRKKKEEELRLSEQKYKLLFESNPMPMWMLSLENMQTIDVNEAACQAYGYSKEEFLQMDLADFRHPDELAALQEELKNNTISPINRGIWKYRKKDQSYIDVEIFAQNIIYNKQRVRLVLAKDVTEMLKTQEKLRFSYEEIRRLASHLQNVREEERKHISHEIHDQLGQQLAAMKMKVSWLAKKMTNTDKDVRKRMEEMQMITEDMVNLVRRISSDLRPGLLDDMGLIAAIEWHLRDFGKRWNIVTELKGMKEEPALSPHAISNLYRIVQESLSNVSLHANAKKVTIDVDSRDQELIIVIQDDGVGFDKEIIAAKRTLGLLGMSERSTMIDASFSIVTNPGQGTTVLIRMML